VYQLFDVRYCLHFQSICLYCHVYVCVNIRRNLDWIIGFVGHTQANLLTTTILSLFARFTIQCYTHQRPQSITVSTSHFLATDFKAGTITVSLNYKLQISLYCSTHEVFSSQLTANPQLALSGPQSLEPAWGPWYVAPGRTQRKTPSLNNTFVVWRCRGNVFTEPLPSNGRCWLQYSGLHVTILLFVDSSKLSSVAQAVRSRMVG
jgi:hypothetical protein